MQNDEHNDTAPREAPTVIVKVVGGSMREYAAADARALREMVGLPDHLMSVNGEPIPSGDYAFEGGEFVTFSSAIKAG